MKKLTKIITLGVVLTFLFSDFGFSQNLNVIGKGRKLDNIKTKEKEAIKIEKDGEWIYWTHSAIDDLGLGTEENPDGGIWTSAIYWDTDDLSIYDGYEVITVSVAVGNLPDGCEVVMWQGYDKDNLTEMTRQSFDPDIPGLFYDIDLDETFEIDASQQLWLGVEWDDPGYGVYPASINYESDAPDDGKGSMILFGQYSDPDYEWLDIHELNDQIIWSMLAYIENKYEGPRYTVTFNVTDIDSGDPLEGAEVSFIGTGITDDTGQVIFEDIIPGTRNYTVSIETHDNITNEIIVDDDDITINVEMEKTPVYEVTFSVEAGNGSITATANGDDITSGDDVFEGSEVIFTADPEEGNRVLDWYVDGVPISSTDSTYTINSLDDDVDVKVEFEETPTYTVTFSVEAGHGSIVATVNGNGIDSGDDIYENSEVVFTATPDGNNNVIDWYVNGTPIGSTDLTYTINSLDDDVDVKVEFEEIPTFTVTFDVEAGNGTISATANGDDITSGDDVFEGSEVIFTAAPEHGHRVLDWYVDGEPIGYYFNSYTIFSLDDDVDVKVEFEEIPLPKYTVVFDVVDDEGGFITATADGNGIDSGDEVEEDSEVIFTANPYEGYKVYNWYLNGLPQNSTLDTYKILYLFYNVDVQVEFEEETSVLTTHKTDMSVFPNPANSKLNVESDKKIKQIKLITLSGKIVKTKDVNTHLAEIDVNNIKPGVYFIEIQTADSVYFERVQLIR